MVLSSLKVLSSPAAPFPIAISKYKMNLSIDALLQNRPLVLRNLRERAI